jgi:hypothetical protein
VNSFTKEVSRLYMEKTGIKTNIFKVESVNGVHAFVYDGSN